jgi:KDO2-lipid IV(A) lauroyltransferase
VPFFDHPAWTHPVLARMTVRTGAPVVPTFALRAGPGSYTLRYEAPIAVEELSPAESENVPLTGRFMKVLEDAIRTNPDQWLWYHDRWKQLRLA